MRTLKSVLFGSAILFVAGCSTTSNNPNYQQVTKYKGSTPYVNGVQVQQANYNMPATASSQSVSSGSYERQQAPAPVTYAPQHATYVTNKQEFNECISKESNRKMLGAGAGAVVGGLVGRKIGGDQKTLGTVAGAAIGGAAGYGIADKSIRCDQVSAPVVHTNQPYGQTYGSSTVPAQTQAVSQAVSYETSSTDTLSNGGTLQENTNSLGDQGTPGYYAVNGLTPPAQAVQPAQSAQIQTIVPQQVQPATPAPIAQPKQTQAYVPVPLNTTAGTIRHRIVAGDTLYSLARTSCSSVSELQSLNSVNSEFYIRAGEDMLLPSGRCTE